MSSFQIDSIADEVERRKSTNDMVNVLSYLFVCYVRMCIYHIYVCNVQISTNDMINVLTYCRFSYMEESVHCRQMSL